MAQNNESTQTETCIDTAYISCPHSHKRLQSSFVFFSMPTVLLKSRDTLMTPSGSGRRPWSTILTPEMLLPSGRG